jgi:thioredoxin-disulfide reductase
MYDLIIIGGGPAGMTAAIYAARQKNDCLLITRDFGGQMARKDVEIENYPGVGRVSAQELIARFRDHLAKLGAPVMIGTVSALEKTGDVFVVRVENENIKARAAIIATGSEPMRLDIPGEKEFIGCGVCYCVTCDGPLFSKRAVAVIGGGNSAFESAIFLAKFAKKIFILERGPRLAADGTNQDLAQKTGKVEVITNAQAVRVEGDNFVRGLAYVDAQENEIVLPVEGIFVKVGNRPESAFAADLVDRNDRGEIKFDCQNYQTKTPGLFVAGDVSEIKYKQIVVAAGEGAKAAMAAEEYLKQIKS